MRRLVLVLPMAVLVGCSLLGGADLLPGTVSCQPVGYTPAPIAFTAPGGPVTADVAEQTAVALFRACHDLAIGIADLTSTVEAGAGSPVGPNEGQDVWVVRVDAMVTEPGPGATYGSHYWIEVNRATGIPVVIGYG